MQQYRPLTQKRTIGLTFYPLVNLSPPDFFCKIHTILLHYKLKHFSMLLLCYHISLQHHPSHQITFAMTSFKLQMYASYVS